MQTKEKKCAKAEKASKKFNMQQQMIDELL
jgi:hypothetical protein